SAARCGARRPARSVSPPPDRSGRKKSAAFHRRSAALFHAGRRCLARVGAVDVRAATQHCSAMTQPAPLTLFNGLTRRIEPFDPVHPGEARVYSCGPTVYNYQHIGNMRAYVFADTLGRTLSFKGYALRHIINITDVGHLTSDADAGDDKMEKAAASQGKSAWDIAAFYTAEFKRDLAWL